MLDTNHVLFVISDLHLGGEYPKDAEKGRGFRICTHVPKLVTFIKSLTERPRETTTELVINGDMVDFLAERSPDPENPWRAFTENPFEALVLFNRIVERDQSFFDALRDFLAAGHRLTLTLGNHDLELSLPAVRKRLEEILGVHRTSSFRFIYDNEAYVVGEVLIEHGNRYDRFNAVDHDWLRRLRSAQSRRLPLARKYSSQPPVGSRLVAEIINPIKEEFCFVDLLKPEREAVIPTLLALKPRLRGHLSKLIRVFLPARRHQPTSGAEPAYGGNVNWLETHNPVTGESYQYGSSLLAIETSRDFAELSKLYEDPLRTLLTDIMPDSTIRERFEEGIADRSESLAGRYNYGDEASALAETRLGKAISLGRLLVSHGDPSHELYRDLGRRLESLLDALHLLQNDRSFDLHQGPVAYDNHIKELLGVDGRIQVRESFKVIVFGHTHLARDIIFENGGRYLNSGTWGDLIRLPQRLFADSRDEALLYLRDFINDLIDNNLGPYLHHSATYAQIDINADGRVASASLKEFHANSSNL